MFKKLLVGVLLGVATAASAQTNFRPGYVLTLAGDTLRGEVDSRGAQRNARLARYRPSASEMITDYQPRQLRGYGFIGDRIYQRETVLLADSAQSPGQFSSMAELPRPSFLEVVVRGMISLLYLRDERGNDHYYLQTNGQPVQELIQKISYSEVDGSTRRILSDDYRRTLAAATQSCLSLQPAITKVSFNLNSLARIVRDYNNCVGTNSVEPASAIRRNHAWLSAIAGGEKSQLVLTDDYAGLTATGNSPVQPVLGLALNLRMAGVNQAIAARVEMFYDHQTYTSMKTERNNQASPQTGFNSNKEYRAKLSSIRLPLLVRYTYPRGRVRPIAYVGYSLNLLLKNENEVRNNYAVGGPSFAINWHPWIMNGPRKLEQGIVGGMGLSSARTNGRNASLELRYERSDGFSDSPGFGSRVTRFYMLLSYDLTK